MKQPMRLSICTIKAQYSIKDGSELVQAMPLAITRIIAIIYVTQDATI